MSVHTIKHLNLEYFKIDEFLKKYPRTGGMLVMLNKTGSTKKVADEYGVGRPWVRELVKKAYRKLHYYRIDDLYKFK